MRKTNPAVERFEATTGQFEPLKETAKCDSSSRRDAAGPFVNARSPDSAQVGHFPPELRQFFGLRPHHVSKQSRASLQSAAHGLADESDKFSKFLDSIVTIVMDGLDLESLDRIDQEIFNGSPFNSDGEEEDGLPVPDCIGIDSAIQDEESSRIARDKANQSKKRQKTRSELEQELEMKSLKPNSLRGQILETSLNHGNNNNQRPSDELPQDGYSGQSHVMNIVEKAGMKGIDKERINEIIHEASKGSLFYKKQAQRQEEIHRSIERMLNKVKSATPTQVANAKVTCDRIVKELEKQRCFNRIIVHFDLDMFFAAVEIRDNPELADKPIAVGGDSMVSTSNYVARRYGVRAAMPGFIAKKLCPNLLLIKPNGFKYRQASADVFDVLEQYDPELTCMSLDEAYLDLTDYIKCTLERDCIEHEEFYDGTLPKIWWTRANELVQEIRNAIYEKTKLTCSAGIACNTLLAKISTDIKKPNGQHMISGYPQDVSEFINGTPVGKVSGIGKVSEQFLNALDIKTCGDIYEKRHFLPLVFYEINVRFYLRVAFGDGPTCIKSDDQGRKSKSVERTFAPTRDTLNLLDKLDSISEELCTKYLRPYRIRGRTITLKLKRNTFTTTTKSYSMLVPTNDKIVIYSAAKSLLLAELNSEPPEISFRLLGVKLSNLADEGVTSNQMTIDAMLRNQEMSKKTNTGPSVQEGQSTSGSQNDVKVTDSSQTQEIDLSNLEIGNPDNTPNEGSQSSANEKDLDNSLISHFFKPKSGLFDEQSDLDSTERPEPLLKDIVCPAASPVSDGDATDPNSLSQSERNQNNPIEEEFQCPYCFKAYCDFELLEKHVDENCRFKTSIDVYKSFSQKRPSSSQPANDLEDSHVKKKSKIPAATQPTSAKKKQQHRDQKPKTPSCQSSIETYLTSKPSQSFTQTKSANLSKTSFYDKFMESNSQTLSQMPKIEPYNCPYCYHGFLGFKSLEDHVVMCTKNTGS